jgi:hypothetical protein
MSGVTSSTAPDPRARAAPRDPYHVPHRKNAAEWVMWLALRPLVPVVRLIGRLRTRKEHRHG